MRVLRLIGFIIIVFIFHGCSSSHDKAKPQPEEELFDAPAKPTSQTSGIEHVIEIKAMQFVPGELRIHKGDKVTWINRDIVDHDITEQAKTWASSRLAAGASWSMVVMQSQDYFCNLHVVMKGKIIVE